MTTNETPKKIKHQGPIRWNAVIPFTVFLVIVGLYMHFLFDGHLRRLAEWGLTKGLGVEVNIADVDTSFWRAHMRIAGIEVTDSETPTRNSIRVGEIRYGMLWDALLRAKVVVNEAVIEQIEFGTPRKHRGWVKPPEPPATGPSALDKLKDQALDKVQTQYEDNVFGDLAAILGGAGADVQMEKLKDSLASKKMAEDLDREVKAKQVAWQERLKTLPKGEEFQKLGDRLKAVKTSGFKSPQELQQSLQEFDAIFKEADAKVKTVQAASNDLNADLKKINDDVKLLEAQIKADVKKLETHFKIPNIDAKALTMSLFRKYVDKYLNKFETYRDLVAKYAPPNLMQKNQPDPSMQPRPRAEGLSYEFGRPNSYPLVWIKHTAISSQAGTSPNAGDIRGQITDISTNQILTGKPTVVTVDGDFPGMGVRGLSTKLTVDNRREESVVELLMGVKAYPIEGRDLVTSKDVNIAFQKAAGAIDVKAVLRGLKDLRMNVANRFNDVEYAVSSTNAVADEMLKKIFTGLPPVSLDAELAGVFPRINLNVNSNLGPELSAGLSREVNAKIAEARAKIEKFVQDEVGKTKAQIETEIAKLRNQVDGEVKKIQAQAEAQKKQAEDRANQAKKDTENQGKKKVEEEAKKAAEELKKRLGF